MQAAGKNCSSVQASNRKYNLVESWQFKGDHIAVSPSQILEEQPTGYIRDRMTNGHQKKQQN